MTATGHLARQLERLVLRHIASLVRMTLRDTSYGKSLLADANRGHVLADQILRLCVQHGLEPLQHVSQVISLLQLQGRAARDRDFLALQHARTPPSAELQIEQLNTALATYEHAYRVRLWVMYHRQQASDEEQLSLLLSEQAAASDLYRLCRLSQLSGPRAMKAAELYRVPALMQVMSRPEAYRQSNWGPLIPSFLDDDVHAIRSYYRRTR